MKFTRSWAKPIMATICCGIMASIAAATTLTPGANAHANNPPVFNTPRTTTGSYLFPGFAAVSITFAGDPVTDQENDDITYSYRANLPGINSEASLDEALLEAIENPNGFSFQRKTGYTIQEYVDVYGDRRDYDISLIIRATDTAGGFDELTITVTVNHLGSPQYLGATSRLNQFESAFDRPVTVYEGQAANLGWPGPASGIRTKRATTRRANRPGWPPRTPACRYPGGPQTRRRKPGGS